jgi:peptidyl-prolyl cis-trans isomerase C
MTSRPIKRALAGLLLILVCGLITMAVADDTDKAVAVVNGQIILESDLKRHISMLTPQLSGKDGTIDEQRRKQLEQKVLDDLISRELMYQASQKAGIKVSAAEVEKELGFIKRQYGGGDTFQLALKKMSLTEEEMRHNIVQGKSVRKLIDQEIVSKISVTEDEIRSHYKKNREAFRRPEMVRARHILIKVAPDASEEEKRKALDEITRIQKRIKTGEDFAALAKKFSQGPSASRGGELGFFARGKMVKPFEEAAFALRAGEVSGIVETRFGYHLINVVEHNPSSIESYQSAKRKIERFLKQGKTRKAIDAYVADLKAKADIKKFIAEKEAS